VVNRNATSPWPFIAMGGMAVSFFPYAVSGLVAPWYGVMFLLLVWAALFVLACRWWTRRPKLMLVLPLVAFVLFFAVIAFGGAFLGWTA
jgi:hypothetical protein